MTFHCGDKINTLKEPPHIRVKNQKKPAPDSFFDTQNITYHMEINIPSLVKAAMVQGRLSDVLKCSCSNQRLTRNLPYYACKKKCFAITSNLRSKIMWLRKKHTNYGGNTLKCNYACCIISLTFWQKKKS